MRISRVKLFLPIILLYFLGRTFVIIEAAEKIALMQFTKCNPRSQIMPEGYYLSEQGSSKDLLYQGDKFRSLLKLSKLDKKTQKWHIDAHNYLESKYENINKGNESKKNLAKFRLNIFSIDEKKGRNKIWPNDEDEETIFVSGKGTNDDNKIIKVQSFYKHVMDYKYHINSILLGKKPKNSKEQKKEIENHKPKKYEDKCYKDVIESFINQTDFCTKQKKGKIIHNTLEEVSAEIIKYRNLFVKASLLQDFEQDVADKYDMRGLINPNLYANETSFSQFFMHSEQAIYISLYEKFNKKDIIKEKKDSHSNRYELVFDLASYKNPMCPICQLSCKCYFAQNPACNFYKILWSIISPKKKKSGKKVSYKTKKKGKKQIENYEKKDDTGDEKKNDTNNNVNNNIKSTEDVSLKLVINITHPIDRNKRIIWLIDQLMFFVSEYQE